MIAGRAVSALLHGRLIVIEVEGRSMAPTLVEGDLLLCERVRAEVDLRRGSIVILEHAWPDGSRSRQVKRLIACAGEQPAGALVPVPKGMCWIVGDNLEVSGDSRRFGPVPRQDIVAVTFARLRGGRLIVELRRLTVFRQPS